MHCSFHFLNVSNGPTSILPNISVTLRKSHKTILWGIFEKSQIPARDVFETSQRCHRKDIFFEICLRRLKDIIQKTSFLRWFWDVLQTSQKKTSFLRCIWDALKTSQESRLFWDVSERSLRSLSQWRSDWDFSETSHAGWASTKTCSNFKKRAHNVNWMT